MAPLALNLRETFDALLPAIQGLALVVALLIAICSLDDLIIDAWYWGRTIFRALVIRRRHARLPEAALHAKPEQPMAIIIPAWQEKAVIAAMIENTIATLSYTDYSIYVGTYPNDPETCEEVKRGGRGRRRVICVEVSHPGPTSKADCLNHVMARIKADEAKRGVPYAGVVMHDPEDVIHPLELKYFNLLLPRKDLIQLPVVSLERRLRDLVAGAYMDEFAEWHAKDLVVREAVAHSVPSAGVGTCLSHKAIEALTADGGEVFNTSTLTEDYDLGTRLAMAGLGGIIGRFPVEFRVRRKRHFGLGGEKTVVVKMPMCVREYFPDTFVASYRQKARWTIGIALQGWTQIGWSWDPRVNFFLIRDRKAIFVPSLVMISYLVFGLFAATWAVLGQEALTYPAKWDALAQAAFSFNLITLGIRAGHRFYFVNRIYGWEHGLMAMPRMVVASLVGFAATMRALRIFASHLITGKAIGWDKTHHVFPSQDELMRKQRQLGDILVNWEALTEEKLDWALKEQKATEQPLGKILRKRGWLDEETLAEAIATQAELPRAHAVPEAVERNRDLLPQALLIQLFAAPLGRTEEGAVILGVARRLSDEKVRLVIEATGHPPEQLIVKESDVARALRDLQGTPHNGFPLLGDLLVERGDLRMDEFESALASYVPERDGRLGEYLVESGRITREQLVETIAEQRSIAAGRH